MKPGTSTHQLGAYAHRLVIDSLVRAAVHYRRAAADISPVNPEIASVLAQRAEHTDMLADRLLAEAQVAR